MSETEFASKSFTLDAQTLARLLKMAAETDRSISAMVRVCINEKWERMHPTSALPPLSEDNEKQA